MDSPSINYKGAPFRLMFKEPVAFVDFYKDVFGEIIPAENVQPFDLDTDLLSREIYNDVSHLIKSDDGTKDRLLVMVEHQSNISYNLPLRLMFYHSDLLQHYIKQSGLNLHSTNKLDLPEPEFIVAYNGAKEHPKMSMPFGMTVPINIADINFAKLKNKSTTSYLAGYSYFIQEQEALFHHFKSQGFERKQAHQRAYNEALEDTINKGFVVDTFKRREFQMSILAYRDHGLQLKEEAKTEGRLEGRLEGIEQTERLLIEKYVLKRGFGNVSPKSISETFDIDYNKAVRYYDLAVAKINSDPDLKIQNLENALKNHGKKL